MQKPKSIHFVGIKGVGMTPLAIIAHEAGIRVTGSDIDEKFITDVPLHRAGIQVQKGFSADHVGEVDLVITTGAHGGYENREVKTAKEKHIPVLTKGEAVGAFMEGSLLGASYHGISVAGSHGKTTTSAMLASILKYAGKDPGYLIGTSEIPSLSGMPGHFGTGEFFIAEADEYANEPVHDKTPQFWHQHPKIAIVTNIEHDHPDIYPTSQDVLRAFKHFVSQMPDDGVLIICGDGEFAKTLIGEYSGKVITYGRSLENDFSISEYKVVHGTSEFSVSGKDKNLGSFRLKIPGIHNALNGLAAVLAALETGISLSEIKNSLQLFVGTKRRLERKGQIGHGAIVYDDYAHHPTEIVSSLNALAALYPEKQLVCIFQPHTYSRTKELFLDFVDAFSEADMLILLPIFSSSRERPDATISSEMLAQTMKEKGKHVLHLKSQEDVVEYIDKNQFGDDTVIVTMGAGDVYKISENLQFRTDNNDYSGENRAS